MNNSIGTQLLTCKLCTKAINLAENIVADEHGNPVHEECQEEVLLMKKPRQPPERPSNPLVRDASLQTL